MRERFDRELAEHKRELELNGKRILIRADDQLVIPFYDGNLPDAYQFAQYVFPKTGGVRFFAHRGSQETRLSTLSPEKNIPLGGKGPFACVSLESGNPVTIGLNGTSYRTTARIELANEKRVEALLLERATAGKNSSHPLYVA